MKQWKVVCFLAFIMSVAGVAASANAQMDDAVAGRLGGTGAEFTAKYGEPIDSAKVPGFDGATVRSYEVFGFSEVSAGVFDGDVVGLTLRPVVGDTWTAEAIEIVIGDFGPDDAGYDTRQSIGPSDDGFRTAAQGTSEAIEDAIDVELYEELDLGGGPGDFFVVYYQSPTPNFYVALTITLGTLGERDAIALASGIAQSTIADEVVVPEPDERENSGGVQPLTPEELLYAAEAGDIAGDVVDASSKLGDLFGGFDVPDYFDPEWQVGVATQIYILQDCYDRALALVPPPAFAKMHSYFLSALQKYDQAADLLVYGIDNLDSVALAQAAALVESAAVDMTIANSLLDQIRAERGI